MKLVWHIVRKDARLLRLPWLLWLGLELGHTFLLWTYWGGNQIGPLAFEGLRYYAIALGAVVMGVGFVLAAWLVMEDNLVATHAFWPTRPISGARLLAAKALGAVLMFSVAPAVVMTPLWLACGFSLRELGDAAWQLAAGQALCSAAALVIAGVTATSVQFLTRIVGGVVLVILSLGFVADKAPAARGSLPTGVLLSQDLLVIFLLAVVPLVVLVHQYLTRRTGRSWALGGLGCAFLVAVPFYWKWDLGTVARFGAGAAEPLVARSVELTAGSCRFLPTVTSPDRRLLRLEGTLRGLPAGSYVRINPTTAEWKTGDDGVPLYRRMRAQAGAERPSADIALRHVAGLDPTATGPVAASWSAEGEEWAEQVEWARAAAKPLQVTMNLSLMRGQVLGELPLRVGAELRSGACLTRIIGIERNGEKILVRLEDRDMSPFPLFVSERPRGGPGPFPTRAGEDCFVLVHRSPNGGPLAPDLYGPLQVSAGHPIGTLLINSILVGQRELSLTPPTRTGDGGIGEIPGWEKDAVIIQVRFRPEATFTRPLTVNPFAP